MSDDSSAVSIRTFECKYHKRARYHRIKLSLGKSWTLSKKLTTRDHDAGSQCLPEQAKKSENSLSGLPVNKIMVLDVGS